MFGLGVGDGDLVEWLVVRNFCVWFLVVWVGFGKLMVLMGMDLGYVDCVGCDCEFVWYWGCFVIGDDCYF